MSERRLSEIKLVVDCRLMFHRRAGISSYTRRLVQALAQASPHLSLTVLMDRRDRDTDWIPPTVARHRAITPAHHRYEQLTLPLELAVLRQTSSVKRQSPISNPPSLTPLSNPNSSPSPLLVHFPDFIACRGPFKKIITIHDLYFMEHPEVMGEDGARYYGGITASAARADAIIAVSAFTRRDILRLLPAVPADKIHVVLEAADEVKDDNAASPSIQRSGQDHKPHPLPYVLFVGTFEPRKNLRTLLQALPFTPPDLRVVMVGASGWGAGGGDEPAKLAQDLGVTQRVQLAGRVTDAELDELYRGARALVFPSLSEGFGLPALEAMSRGIPVICSNTGSLPEIVSDAALLHDPTDARQLAQHLTHLWTDDVLHANYRLRGLARAQQFSWQKAAQETAKIYEELRNRDIE